MNRSAIPVDLPTKVYLEITTDCNLDCGMCVRHSWEEPGGSMDARTFNNLLAHIRDTPSIRTVNFSGFGEPTEHPRFFDFLEQVKHAGLTAEVVTNGLNLDEPAARRMVDLRLDKLIVSLDEPRPSENRFFHEVEYHNVDLSKTAFPKADSEPSVHGSLRGLYQMKIFEERSLPEVCVEFVATKRNIHQLPLLRRMGRDLGFASILVTNLVPYTAEMAHDILYDHWTTAAANTKRSPWMPEIDLPRLDLRGPAMPVFEELATSGGRLMVNGENVVGGGMYCRFVNEGFMAITPGGDVTPCLPLLHTYTYFFRNRHRRSKTHRVGNVNHRSLDEIWSDPEYQAFRHRVSEFSFSPCIDCGGCDLRDSNEKDCYNNPFPTCGECLWAAGLVQCP
ncbi:MAG: SPASM domain-containing protein [Pirellulales bacterium]|nr:SPASM domain-containing protein [Pirellulales bacterium]